VNTRNGFTYVANIFILTAALLLFIATSNQVMQFRVLSIGAVCIGSVTSLYYVFTINEPKLTKAALECEEAYKVARGISEKNKNTKGKSAGDWLGEA